MALPCARASRRRVYLPGCASRRPGSRRGPRPGGRGWRDQSRRPPPAPRTGSPKHRPRPGRPGPPREGRGATGRHQVVGSGWY
ncbi:MAG: hypothetical protein EOO66_00175 [Methylobacterium sp.]|nr:MAG: hypothetical protein EOO66_00175 [Methylobacterium sp.]